MNIIDKSNNFLFFIYIFLKWVRNVLFIYLMNNDDDRIEKKIMLYLLIIKLLQKSNKMMNFAKCMNYYGIDVECSRTLIGCIYSNIYI